MVRYLSEKEEETKKESKGMVDLKLPKKKKEELVKVTEAPEKIQDRYPWGTRITFENETIEKFPHLKNCSVGEKVNIKGVGEIISVRSNQEMDGDKKFTVEIQLQKVSVDL